MGVIAHYLLVGEPNSMQWNLFWLEVVRMCEKGWLL